MSKNSLLFLLSAWGAGAAASASFLTDIDGALARAKLEKKPLLISFYGIWCPPCNQLEEVVFESGAFLQAAKRFVLLKVDADAEGSWAIKDRFRVGGYPTVVFATPEAKEIYRVVGVRSQNEFLRTMGWVYDNRNRDLTQACRKKGTPSLWHCGFTCAEKGDEACAGLAFRALEPKLRETDPKLHFIRGYYAKTIKEEARRKGSFAELVKRFPKSPFVFSWAMEIIDGKDELPGELRGPLSAVLSAYETVLKHPQLELTGLMPTDVSQMRAEILERIGDVEKAKAAWLEAATMLSDLAQKLPHASAARGYTLERISCLDSAGAHAAALELTEAYRKKYPKEFTFHYRAANILKRMGKNSEAVGPAREAYQNSYGDNRIRSATLLIQLLAAASDKSGAKTIYDEMKSAIRPDAKLEVRSHRYWKALEEAYGKI